MSKPYAAAPNNQTSNIITLPINVIPAKAGIQKRDDVLLFSESNSRFIAEVSPKAEKALAKIFKGIPMVKIGTVEASPELVVYGLKDQPGINARIDELKEIWKSPLR